MENKIVKINKVIFPIIILLFIFLIFIRIPMNEKVLYLFSMHNLSPKLVIPLIILLYLSFTRKGYVGYIYSLTIVVLLFAMSLMWQWNSGYTNTAQLAGYFPTSDASVYYTQAYSLLTTGSMKSIASFRPLFHILFASLFAISNLNLLLVQGVFSFINALSCFLAANELRKTHGALSAAIFVLVGFYFSRYHLNNIMTEQLGFMLGNLSFAFLWNGINNKNKINIFLGIFSLSYGLVVRPGAMFILPLLIIWIGWYFKGKNKFSFLYSLLTLCVILLPFILNSIYSRLYSTSEQSLFANYGYTLYGVVSGNKGWNQFSIDYPEKMPDEAYQIAWQEFIKNPKMAFEGMGRAYLDYFNPEVINAFSFIGMRKPIHYYPLFILFFLNIIYLIIDRKKDINTFILFSITGILLSVPFVPTRDVGYRSYVVTNPILISVLLSSFPWIGNIIKELLYRIRIIRVNINQNNYQKQNNANPTDILNIGYIIMILIFCLNFFIPLFIFPHHNLSVQLGQFHCKKNQIPIGYWTHKNDWIHVVSDNTILNGIHIPAITKGKLARLIEGYGYHRERGYDILVNNIMPGNSFSWIPYNYFDSKNKNKATGNIVVINTDILPNGAGFIQFCGEKVTYDKNKPITEYLVLASNLHKNIFTNKVYSSYSPQFVNIVLIIIFLSLFIICLETIIYNYRIN